MAQPLSHTEGVAHTKYPLSIHIHCQNAWKRTKLNLRKSVKINLRIISKPYAHIQGMVKTSVKFHKNRNNTVAEVVQKKVLKLI